MGTVDSGVHLSVEGTLTVRSSFRFDRIRPPVVPCRDSDVFLSLQVSRGEKGSGRNQVEVGDPRWYTV